jgi:hypothetical protein
MKKASAIEQEKPKNPDKKLPQIEVAGALSYGNSRIIID